MKRRPKRQNVPTEFHAATEAEALFLEQAQAYFRDVQDVANRAPDGKVIDQVEASILLRSRQLVRQSMELALQEQIDNLEKKKETSLCQTCQKKKRHRGYRNKNLLTAVGDIELQRRYDECLPCRLPEHVADERIGLEDRYTVGLRRLAVRAGTTGSFTDAAESLEEYCGLKLSRDTIRELCRKEGPKMAAWHRDTPEIHEQFIEAEGEIEFLTDGTCVNTTEGWKEVKTGMFSKRKFGEGVLPDQWEERDLPRPEITVAFAAIEKKDRFRSRWGQWIRRLKIDEMSRVSVLADGAHGIWDAVALEFGKVRECLDVYHALEHLSGTGKILYGAETEEYDTWREETKWELLWNGLELIEVRLENLLKGELKKSQAQSVQKLLGYLRWHGDRLTYRERLAEGRSIGSGQVEGACKNMIGKRLKQTGARWRIRRLNAMASLCAVRYSSQWKDYWKTAL